MTVEVPCAGAVVFSEPTEGTARLLLVRRGHAPSVGLWSLPGGRIEAGETPEAAVVRELAEETGLVGRVVREAGLIRLPAAGDSVYVVHDFVVRVDDVSTLAAGDDATDVGWFTVEELRTIETTHGLLETLARWGLL